MNSGEATRAAETLDVRAADGRTVWRVGVARSWAGRLRGLIGRPRLEDGGGLLLTGANSIHMMFMRFPIDCVFLSTARPDGGREVVALSEHLRPWRGVVWWARHAKDCLEVGAGSAAASGVRRGDVLWLEPARAQ